MLNWIKRLLPYVTAGTLLWGVGCKDKLQIELPRLKSPTLEKILDDGRTNGQGKIQFTDQQKQKPVIVNTKDELGNSISRAKVDFWDGEGWELFRARHPSYVPYLRIFEPDSEHDLVMKSLTSGRMQFHHYTDISNNNSRAAAQRFVDYTKTINRHYIGCLTAKEAKFQAEQENHILNLMKKNKSIGKIVTLTLKPVESYYKVLDSLIKLNLLEGGECAAFQKWYLVPPAQNSKENTRATLWYWECQPVISKEDCNNKIDDDCDHDIDGLDSDCQKPVSRRSRRTVRKSKREKTATPQGPKCKYSVFMSKSRTKLSSYLGVPTSQIDFESGKFRSGKGVSVTLGAEDGHSLFYKVVGRMERDLGKGKGRIIKTWGSGGKTHRNGCYINVQRYSKMVRIQVYSSAF